MILISNDFCHKRKIDNFEPYNVLLAIATNIAVLLMTASVTFYNLTFLLIQWIYCILKRKMDSLHFGKIIISFYNQSWKIKIWI